MADIEKRFTARDVVIWSITEDSCASIGPSQQGLAENFHANMDKSKKETFRAVYTGPQFYADTAVNGTTLRFSEGAVSDGGDGLTKSEHVFDSPADLEVIDL